MRVTIRSIAEAANVSRGTVDKVLNDRIGVSHEVRDRVSKIAEEMGYTPNLAGKALAFQKKPLKIGIILLDKDDYIWQEVLKGIKKAAHELKDFGLIVEYIFMEFVDVQEQIKAIRELLKKNITALVLSPLDDDLIRIELKKLTDDNFKIVIFNTDILGVERLCFVGQNLKKSGKVAGELVGKLLPNGGQVAVMTGPDSIKALHARVAGFEEILKAEYPNVKIIDIVKNIYDNQASYSQTKELINKYPDLKALHITARGIGGVGKALLELNRTDIKFVVYDTIPETVELLKKRVVDFTITQEPVAQGYLPIKILFDYFFQNKIPSKVNIYTKLEIKTKQNVDS